MLTRVGWEPNASVSTATLGSVAGGKYTLRQGVNQAELEKSQVFAQKMLKKFRKLLLFTQLESTTFPGISRRPITKSPIINDADKTQKPPVPRLSNHGPFGLLRCCGASSIGPKRSS